MAAKTWSATVDDNWSTGAAWNGGTVPLTVDTITFDGTSVKNCTIDNLGTWSGGTFTITSAYSGTITKTVSMTTSNFSIAGGTWLDTSGAAWTASTTGTFTQTGGAFTATSATMGVGGNFTISAGSFTHNSGTVTFNQGVATQIVDAAGVSFNLCTVVVSSNNLTVSSGTTVPFGTNPAISLNGTLTINGTLTLTGTFTLTGSTNNLTVGSTGTVTWTTPGTMEITGSVTISSTAIFPNGIAVLASGGSPSQIIDSPATTWGTWIITKTGSSIMTISSGTTIPLGANPTVTMAGALTVNGTLDFTGTCDFVSAIATSLSVSATGVITNGSGVKAELSGITFTAGATIPAVFDITFNSTASTGRTFALGGLKFGKFRRSGSGTATLTLSGNNTFTDFRSDDATAVHSILFTAGSRTTITTLTVLGASGKLVTLASTVGGTKWRMTQTPPYTKICVDFVSLQDSVVDGYMGTWGITGVKGLTGEQPTGIQGITGIQGLTGIQGVTGVQGITGNSPTGASPTGVKGLTGAQGLLTGIQGITGISPTGRQGITGVKGLTGADGRMNQGITGIKGLTGVQGITGNQPTGAPGVSTGAQGITGNQPTGILGLPGAHGLTGVQGITGYGFTGIQSVTGVQSVTGEQPTGTQGITGIKGLTGVQGLTGIQGITGFAPTGARPTGIQGLTGIDGLTGAQSVTGVQGLTGAQVNVLGIDWNLSAVTIITGMDNHAIMPRFGTIKDVLMSLQANGTAGTTIVDMMRGTGTLSTTPYEVTFGTVFTTAGNRPMIGATAASTNRNRDTALPDITAFKKGDVFSVQVPQVATGASNLRVQLIVEYTGT